MNMKSALSIVTEALHQKNPNLKIKRNTEFRKLNYDSLELLDLIVKAEEKYGFQIPDNNLIQIKTVGDLIDIINELTNQK